MKSVIVDGCNVFDLEQILIGTPFDKIFYIGESNPILSKIPNLVHYDCYALPIGKYPDDFVDAEPLDEDVIKKFSECESITMKMFERNDFWFSTSFDKRKEWYFIHLRYWYYIIHKYNVQCFIKSNFAHEVYDFVIYSIMRSEKRKCFFFSQLSFMNRFILEEDIFSYPVLERFLYKNNYNGVIDSEVEKFLNKMRMPPENTNNVFQVIEKKRGKMKNLFKLIKIYNKKYAQEPNFTEKYYFVALHMQPEMTTCPLAGAFVYQELIIELLDYYLPHDIFIYIKEHPAQTCIGRNAEFYEKFYKRHRVKFIRTDVNSRLLADNSMAVVTCTGSIGWETLIRCKPVLMFGNYFYQSAPGCFLIKSKDDLIKAIEKIAEIRKINQTDIDYFFQKVYNYSYYGYVDRYYSKIVNISDEENKRKLSLIVKDNIYKLFDDEGV